MKFFILLFGLAGAAVLHAQSPFTLTLHEYSDPDRLNPVTSTSGHALHLFENLFNRLLEYDPQTLQLRPQLAVRRPEIQKLKGGTYNGGMSLTYEIRPEAVWDDGSPITGYDYLFTLKAFCNPHVATGILKAQFAFIDSVEISESNPRRFTLYSRWQHFLAEAVSGELFILPEHIYDPDGLMRRYSIQRLMRPADLRELLAEEPLMDFADRLHATDHPGKETFVVEGSGPYRLKEWLPGKQLTFERKTNWWGDKIQDSLFRAYPQTIVYKVIPYYDAAVFALVNDEIDIMRSMRPQTFLELQKTPEFAQRYLFYSTEQLSYYYVAFNIKNPKFSDKRVREALTRLFNRDEIIKTHFYGLAVPCKSPINPRKPHYNPNLPDWSYSVETAAALLDKAGWKDTDKDGIRDKTIEGKKMPLRIQYKYNKGNAFRRDIGKMLQEQAKKVGVEVELVELEWGKLLEDMQRRDFDMCCMAWFQGHGLDDMRQIWHSQSDTPEGSNRVGFGNANADKLIESIERELDDAKRNQLYAQLQEIITGEIPYAFLVVPQECIVVSSRFAPVLPSAIRPHCHERYVRLK